MDKKNLLIDREEKDFTKSELALIDWINFNARQFISSNVNSIAKLAYVSPAVITRLVRKLDYFSFKLFQLDMASKLQHHKEEQLAISDGTEIKDIAHNLYVYYMFSLKKTLLNLDLKIMKKLVRNVKDSKQILIYGCGSNFVPVLSLQHFLSRLGFDAIYEEDFNNSLLKLSLFNSNDLVILFSKNAVSKEINFIIKRCAKNNINVFLITLNNTIASKKNLDVLRVSNLNDDYMLSANSLRHNFLFIVDIICNSFFRDNRNELIKRNKEIISEWNNY